MGKVLLEIIYLKSVDYLNFLIVELYLKLGYKPINNNTFRKT